MAKQGTDALISVVMPVFNEAAGIREVAFEVVQALSGRRFELILVDDGSTDGSWEAIQDVCRKVPEAIGLHFTRNFGHQAALLAGLNRASGEAVITLDSDGEHPPELIRNLLDRWEAGAAVVQGIRADSAQVGLFKRLTSRSFYGLFKWLTGVETPPGSADFRLLSRPVVDAIKRHSGSVVFLRGLIPWLGFKTDYVQYELRTRRSGRTKYSPSKMLGLAINGIVSFSTLPLQLSIWVGALVSLISFAYLAYAVYIRLVSDKFVPGWTSTVALVTLLGGVQLVLLGIVGLYIGKIFFAHLNRPLYVIDQTAGRDDST